MKTSISVVIPTYNGNRYILKALESVFAQTEQPKEIVVVDDRSQDDTPAIIHRSAKSSPVPIHFYQLPTNSGGPSRPLNIGIRSAASPLIAILEQDDTMAPLRLEAQRTAIESFPDCDLAFGRYSVTGYPGDLADSELYNPQRQLELITREDFSSLPPVLRIPSAIAFSTLIIKNYAISNSNFMFRKDLWAKARGFNPRVRAVADIDFLLKCAPFSNFAFVNTEVLVYQYHELSLNRQNLSSTFHEWDTVVNRHAVAHPELLGDNWWGVYWTCRRMISHAFRTRQWKQGFSLCWYLLRTGAFWRHYRLRHQIDTCESRTHVSNQPE